MKKFLVLLLISIISITGVRIDIANAALTDNITAYYKLDGNSNDSVGTLHGTDTNVSYSSSYGKINQGGLYADASGSRSVIGNAGGSQDYVTFAAWVNPTRYDTSLNTLQVLAIVGYNNWNANEQFNFSVQTEDRFASEAAGNNYNTIRLYIYGQSPDTQFLHSTSSISSSGWVHVAATYSTATKKVRYYINGVYISSDTFTTAPKVNLNNITVGSWYVGATWSSYDGQLDEVGIWTRVLSDAEITELYNSGTGIQYPFSGGGGTTESSTQIINFE